MNEERFKIIIKTILKIAIFLLASLVVFIFFVSVTYGYDEVITYILTSYGKVEKIDVFKLVYLTKPRFLLIQLALVFSLIPLVILWIKAESANRFLFKVISITRNTLSTFFFQLFLTLKELPLGYKLVGLLLLLFSLVSKVYFITQFPFTEDEVFSYVYLVDKGFLVSATYYPGPNNHILYNLCCVITDWFINEPLWVMRTPALIASMVLPFILYYFVKKVTNTDLAFLSALLSLFSHHLVDYSIHGRGYLLVIVLTVITLFSAFLYVQSYRKRWLIIVGISSVLGLYTIPVFLYPFVSVFVYLAAFVVVKKEYRRLKEILYVTACIVLCTGILYSPIILLNGLNALVGNSWVKPMDTLIFLNSLPEYIIMIYLYLGFSHSLFPLNIGFIIMIVGGIILYKNNKNLLYIFLFLLIIPLFVLLIQRVQPFERVWTYTIPFLVILISEGILFIIRWIKQAITGYIIGFVVVTFSIYSCYVFENRISEGFPYYENIANFKTYFNGTPARTYLVTDETYHLFVRYFALLESRKVKISSTHSGNENFDMVVINEGIEWPDGILTDNYKLSYSNDYIEVYLRK